MSDLRGSKREGITAATSKPNVIEDRRRKAFLLRRLWKIEDRVHVLRARGVIR